MGLTKVLLVLCFISFTVHGSVLPDEGSGDDQHQEVINSSSEESFERLPRTAYDGIYVPLEEPSIEEAEKALRENVGSTGRGGRIVLGNSASVGQFPFFGYAVLYRAENYVFCGSALVSANRVLTAGHCMTNCVKSVVSFGSIDKTRLTLSVPASGYMKHSSFIDNQPWYNDIALIFLSQPVASTPTISPINLPTRAMVAKTYAGMTLMATGFGYTGTEYPRYQLYTYLTGVTSAECKRSHSVFRENMLCAKGTIVAGSSICFGDSGGPLIYYNSGVAYLVGINSFVRTNECINDVQGFTRVDSHLDWISRNAGISA